MENSSVKVFRRRNEDCAKNTCSRGSTFVRTELQLRFAWCMMGLTREEYDSEERKRSKERKRFSL